MSNEHFTVDGTLIEAWASLKSFRPKEEKKRPPPDDPGNPTVTFKGEKRCNETHESKTDPDARLARKGAGKEAKLSYSANALMENRHGLLVDFRIDSADGEAERRLAVRMLYESVPGKKRITVAGDKGDTRDFVEDCRQLNATPHVAQNEYPGRSSALDGRTVRHLGIGLANGYASVSKRFSAGSRPSAVFDGRATAGEHEPSWRRTSSERHTT